MDRFKTNIWEKNLCSIVNENKESIDRKVVFNILLTYYLKTGNLYLTVYRPNYVIKDIQIRLKEIAPFITSMKVEGDKSSILFYFDGTYNTHKIIELCVDLWFAFEESFLFFLFEKIKNLNFFDSGNVPWKDILSFYSGYLVFNYGMKDDIIWIGKSDKLSFLQHLD